MSKRKRPFKRIFVGSDLHSGHGAGLTPPDWWTELPANFNVGDGKKAKQRYRRRGRIRFAASQRRHWEFYTKEVEALKPFDAAFWNGDMIDGKGRRSGGTEQITGDRVEQCDMAAQCIEVVGAPENIMTYGTPYHTGEDEDWEDLVAEKVGARKIGGQEWVEVFGVVFDLKHEVGRSGIPHGRYTATARSRLWANEWARRGEFPSANVLIRSHVHYFGYNGNGYDLNITTPALQGPGTKYGVRRCEGTVDFGFLYFDVYPTGEYTWHWCIQREAQPGAKVIRL